jgi:tRNA 2-selenouridine synthase
MTVMESADYQRIFLDDIPLIDVRAPIEFAQGAFPSALNLPLMDDQERESVGICYKRRGPQAALELGHALVNGALKQQRVEAWRHFCSRHPNGFIYCFRGGLRSHIVQEWLQESGISYPLVAGGYKALRNYLLQVIQRIASMPVFVISGNTGCGKTIMINQLPQGIDLEGAARHRGSSFGKTIAGQSGQIDFENRLAIDLLKKYHGGVLHWAIEDEGKIIGSNHVPLELYQAMVKSPIVVIEDPFDVRLERLQAEYIDGMYCRFVEEYGLELGWHKYVDYLQQGLYAIRKRLGYERYQQLSVMMTDAFEKQRLGEGVDGHLAWLAPLLTEYYDPMYAYQLQKKADRIIFRGSFDDVKSFLLQRLTVGSER